MGEREREIVEPSNVVISSASVASSSSVMGLKSQRSVIWYVLVSKEQGAPHKVTVISASSV